MAQERIKMNGIEIWQPDEQMSYNFETKFSEDSVRVQSGEDRFTPLFTVEQYGYKATNIPQPEATKILQIIALGKTFTLHHFSLYHGCWRDDVFRVGKSGNLQIGSLSKDNEYLSELSFNMTGKSPLKEVK